MDEMNEKIGVYIKTNADGYITEVGSDIFIRDFIGWIKIDSGRGDKYAHAQSQYFNKPLIDELGKFNYKYENSIVKESYLC